MHRVALEHSTTVILTLSFGVPVAALAEIIETLGSDLFIRLFPPHGGFFLCFCYSFGSLA